MSRRIYRDVDNGPDACIVRHEPHLPRSPGTLRSRPSAIRASGSSRQHAPTQSMQEAPSSSSSSLPQPAMLATSVDPAMVSATASYTGFPSWVARGDTSHASLQATSTTVNPAASEFAPAATLAEPGHIIPVPGPVRHTPTMADAHPTAAQWWTEAPLPFAFPCPDSSPCWNADGDAFAAAMRVPAPEILITTTPWEEASLYHPPGCIEVPPAALRDKFSENGRGRGRDKARGKGEATKRKGKGKGAPPPALGIGSFRWPQASCFVDHGSRMIRPRLHCRPIMDVTAG
ncbi:hypothetical protein LXA43DRAFT_289398 [Ganoderma leucocontextum]|nr:hypothetical protein LXA43DRAFT_289398 [Ganoderma leucocontextum]